MTTAGEAVQYLQWNKDVAHHDYAAASSYLRACLETGPVADDRI